MKSLKFVQTGRWLTVDEKQGQQNLEKLLFSFESESSCAVQFPHPEMSLAAWVESESDCKSRWFCESSALKMKVTFRL